MADEVGNLVVKFGLDSTGFQNGVANINRQIRGVQTEFAAAAAQIGGFGGSLDGLKLKADSLSQQIALQKEKVAALDEAYKKSLDSKGADAKATQELAIKLNLAIKALGDMETESKKVNQQIQEQTQEVQQQAGTWEKLGGVLDSAKGHLSGLWENIKTGIGMSIGFSVFDTIKEGVSEVVKAGIDFDSNVQQNMITFTQMLGSAQKAKDEMAQLEKFAADTPFELPDVEKGAKQLLAFGFSAQQIIPYLTSIGDAASGLGLGAEGIDRIVLALGQMKAHGTADGNDLLQLMQAGIPVWDILSQKIGKSTAEVQKMVSNGLLPSGQAIDMLISGMEQKFPHMMDVQSKSFAGLMSTLHDNFSQVVGAVMKPAFDWLANDILPKLVSATSKFTTALTNGGLKAALMTLVPPELKANLSGIGPVFDGISNTITTVLNNIKGLAQDVWPFTQQIATSNTKTLQTIIQAVWPTVEQVITSVSSIVRSVVSAVFPTIAAIITAANTVIQKVVQTVWPAIQQVIQFVLKYIVPFAVEMFGELASFIKEIMPQLVTIISAALKAIQSAWSIVWPILKTVLIPVLDTIKTVIKVAFDVVTGIIKVALDLITGNWGKAWTDVKGMFVKIWDDIKAGIENYIHDAERWGENLVHMFSQGVQNKIHEVEDAVQNVAHSIAKFLGFHSPTEAGPAADSDQWAPNFVKMFAQGLQNGSQQVGNAAKTLIQPLADVGKLTNDQLSNNISILKSNLDVLTGALGNNANSIDGLNAKLQNLKQQYANQNEIVYRLHEQYLQLLYTKGAYAKETADAAQAYANESKTLDDLRSQIDSTTQSIQDQVAALDQIKTKVQDLAKTYTDDLAAAKKDYDDQVASANQKLADDEAKLTQQYQQQLDSRAQSLKNFTNLFDAVQNDQAVSGQTLLDNLKGQVQSFEAWQQNMQALSRRTGMDSGLIDELRQMGPQAGAQIAALNTLTDDQLKQYVDLWKEKNADAKNEATTELSGLAADTQSQIAQLQAQTKSQLDQYEQQWEQKNTDIRNNTLQQLQQMVQDAQSQGSAFVDQLAASITASLPDLVGAMGGISAAMNTIAPVGANQPVSPASGQPIQSSNANAVQQLKDTGAQIVNQQQDTQTKVVTVWQSGQQLLSAAWNKIKSDAQTSLSATSKLIQTTFQTIIAYLKAIDLTDTGKNIMQGLLDGLEAMEPQLIKAAKSIADSIRNTIESALDIHSPSRVMVGIGGYVGQGLQIGMDGTLANLQAAANRMAKAAVPNVGVPQSFGSMTGQSGSVSGKGDTHIHIAPGAFASGSFVIPVKDLKEIKDLTDFFNRVPQIAKAMGIKP